MNQTGPILKNNLQKQTVVVIPARFASTRLPGKALLDIGGKPMICRVAERARAAKDVDRVIVATDSTEILEIVRAEGFEAELTSDAHVSGTDRIAEVIALLPEADIIVNLQGDEPLISPETIERAVACMKHEQTRMDGAGIVTTWEPIETLENLLNKDCVKVVIGDRGQALYFSRSPTPFPRAATERHGSLDEALISEPELLKNFRKHTGLYVYRRDVLMDFTRWPATALEKFEGLEQLRALENGVVIRVIQASTPSIGVDTQADLERVREVFRSGAATEFAVR